MARYNEILVGRYNRYLQKLFSMKGEAPAPQLASEISAHLLLFHGVENRNLEGWDRFGVIISAPAVALNQSAVRWRNPASSNVVAVFEKVLVQIGGGGSVVPCYLGGVAGADLAAAAAAGGRLDPRGRSAHTLILSLQNTTPGAPTFGAQILQPGMAAFATTDLILEENQELPLLPNDAFQVVSNLVNNSLVVSAIWRERFLEDSERA